MTLKSFVGFLFVLLGTLSTATAAPPRGYPGGHAEALGAHYGAPDDSGPPVALREKHS